MRYADMTERLRSLGSDKWALYSAARDRITRGEDIIELTIGEPEIDPNPALIEACIASLRAGRTKYSNGRGEPGLIDALVRTYAPRLAGMTRDNVICLPGTQTALFAVMQTLVQTGDGVLMGDPYYATYEGVVRATGAHVQPIPLRSEHGFVLQPTDLEQAVTPASRVLLLNTPHNPTGAVIDRATLAELGAVAIRHNLWIVCDEVYERLTFGAGFASPLELLALQERTVVVSSISKAFAAPGFRSGWAIGPTPFTERLLSIAETMLFGNQPFIADMTEAALLGNFDTAAQMRQDFERRATRVLAAIADMPLLRATMPKGGMFVMIDVSGTGLSGETFAWHLLEAQGVAVMPGSSFGTQAQHLIRIALTVSDTALDEALRRISRFSAQFRPLSAG